MKLGIILKNHLISVCFLVFTGDVKREEGFGIATAGEALFLAWSVVMFTSASSWNKMSRLTIDGTADAKRCFS